jgi:hypothetical protein
MSNGSELKSKSAQALRAAGYKPCPRWWLTQEQMDLVEYMARQNEAEVNRIRAEAKAAPVEKLTREQEIERAWAMVGKARD